MVHFFICPTRFGVLLSCRIIMSRGHDKVYYAVGRGRQVGVYNSWKECKLQVDGIASAKFKKFDTYNEAEEFVNFWTNHVNQKPSESTVSKRNWECTDDLDVICKKKFCERRPKKLVAKEKVLPESSNKKTNNVLEEICKTSVNSTYELSRSFMRPYVSPINYCREEASVCDVINSRPLGETPRDKEEVEDFTFLQEAIKEEDAQNVSSENSVQANALPHKMNIPSLTSTSEGLKKGINYMAHSTSSETSKNLETGNSKACEPLGSRFKMMLPLENGITSNRFPQATPCLNVQAQADCEPERCGSIYSKSVPQNHKLAERYEILYNCLKMFYSAMKSLTNKQFDDPELLVRSLSRFAEVHDDIVSCGVNSQIDAGHVENRNSENEGFLVSKASSPEETGESVAFGGTERPMKWGKTAETRPKGNSDMDANTTPFCGNSKTPIDGKQEPSNADGIAALNLRLDAFERRFDSCLKEVGGIFSELAHLKAEIKDVKESIGTCKSITCAKKGTEPLVESAINFSASNHDRENVLCLPSDAHLSCKFNSRSAENELVEPQAKKVKALKRVLPRNESDFEQSKSVFTGCESDAFDLEKVKLETVDYTSFTVDAEDFVHVYTDGACHLNGRNGAKAGIGVWFGDCHPLNISKPMSGAQTNNAAEIQAARVAIELALKAGVKKLKIFTDSEFLIKCATDWIHRWKKNDWTLMNGGKVRNKTELEKLDFFASKINVRWEKVEAHAGIKGNEMADRLAAQGATKHFK